MLDIINDAVPFARHLDVRVSAMTAEQAKAILPERPQLKNHIGTQHAGALFSVAESASGAVLLASCSDVAALAPPLVREASIQYRRAALGPVVATARLADGEKNRLGRFQRDGRLDVQIDVALTDEGGVEVAAARFQWSFRAKDRRNEAGEGAAALPPKRDQA